MILGVHATTMGGMGRVLGQAREHGLKVLQSLPYRRHHPPTAEELAAFREERRTSGVETLLIHSRFAAALS